MVSDHKELVQKIARLVQERGWNQEDFARIAQLNRHTVREIIKQENGRKLRNATIAQCAKALELQVHELRNIPLEQLIPRMHGIVEVQSDSLKKLQEQAQLPALRNWVQSNLERAAQLSAEEIDELLQQQSPEGALVHLGVEPYVQSIERRRQLLQQVRAVAGTEYLGLLEQFVQVLFEKIQPKLATNPDESIN